MNIPIYPCVSRHSAPLFRVHLFAPPFHLHTLYKLIALVRQRDHSCLVTWPSWCFRMY
eukprot:UN15585